MIRCDSCNKDYTYLPDTGGIIFESKAICPECEPRWRERIEQNHEEAYIRGICPGGMPFSEFVELFGDIPDHTGVLCEDREILISLWERQPALFETHQRALRTDENVFQFLTELNGATPKERMLILTEMLKIAEALSKKIMS